MDGPQRVFLVDGSHLLRGILRRVFENSPGFAVVGEAANLHNLSVMLRETQPDWVVVPIPPGSSLPEPIQAVMLSEFPSIRLMSISTDGSEVRVEWVGLCKKAFHGLSLQELQDIFHSDLSEESR